jgi:transketolase
MSKVALAHNLWVKPDLVATRNGFGEGMLALGKNHDVVALCADLTESTKLTAFKEKYPQRFVEMGVAEQNMATVAAGMALVGKIPFIASFAAFSPGRNWEQIRTTIAYNNVSVKIAGGHAGLNVGPDGATHQMLEDIALMRALPNMTVIVPCDAVETRKATLAIAKHKGPAYIRFGREKTPVMTTDDTPFAIGKATVFREGADATIVACGTPVYQALQAARILEKQGIHVQVINCPSIKPIDKKLLVEAARNTGAFVTVEEHQTHGGLGSAVAEAIAQDWPVAIKMIGVQDKFGESGTSEELFHKHGITPKHIVKAVEEVLGVRKLCSTLHVPSIDSSNEPGPLLQDAAQDKELRLWGGETIRTVPELMEAIEQMSEKTFRMHVNSHRNDFSVWIQDCFGDLTLAEAMRRNPSKEAQIALLNFRLLQVKK